MRTQAMLFGGFLTLWATRTHSKDLLLSYNESVRKSPDWFSRVERGFDQIAVAFSAWQLPCSAGGPAARAVRERRMHTSQLPA
jgi:hypothetical protein